MKPEVLIQGLRSIIALHDRRTMTLVELRSMIYTMMHTALDLGVECLDVNHNGDFGRGCTNPRCWKYGR